MFCSGCGSPLPDNANVCPTCGKPAKKPAAPQTPVPTPPPPPPSPAAQPVFQQPAAGAAPASSINLDAGRIFTFIFQDKEWWKKCLILGLICLIPIVGWCVFIGYFIDVAYRVSDGQELPLPNIDFGNHMSLGFSYLIYTFVLSLIFIVPVSALMIVGTLTKSFIIMMLGQILNFVVSIGLGLYMISAYTIAVSEKNPKLIISIERCLNTFKANAASFLLGYVLWIAASLIGGVGTIACFVGLLVTVPMSMIMCGHLIGQLSRCAK